MQAFRQAIASLVRAYLPPRRISRGRRPTTRLRMEGLEDRSLLATFTVTSTADSGGGSLREALTLANMNAGVDTVAFNIAGAGTKTISPLSPLPALTEGVVIDGTTQPGYTTFPLIEITGGSAGAGSGLRVTANGSTVRALVINSFPSSGVEITSNNNVVDRSIIGMNAAGAMALPNGGDGILVTGSGNTIGGTTSGAGNFISGNGRHGVLVAFATATNNTIAGNVIGLGFNSMAKIPNQQSGVVIISGATSNTVGGTITGSRNLISGNRVNGIQIEGLGTNNNAVHGNYIGNGIGATTSVGNNLHGILIWRGARNNRVGTNSVQGQNVISGNLGSGVRVRDTGTTGNAILGNRIGTNALGTAPLANQVDGITIDSGASLNSIGTDALGAGNLISGNRRHGVSLSDAGTSGNALRGNTIGLDVIGAALGNGQNGVQIVAQATGNVIGGTTLATKNTISANATGILLRDAGTTNNVIQGNYVGTDVSGANSRGNTLDGIAIEGGATVNTLGGASAGAANLISGNARAGVRITGTGTNNNLVVGNTLGLNLAGTASLANAFGVWIGGGASSTVVGGVTTLARNVISGNSLYGVIMTGTGTSNNLVLGSYIGTDPTGAVARANGFDGVYLSTGAANNTIGGAAVGAGNLISGNLRNGVRIDGGATTGTNLRGNTIGLSATNVTLLNGQDGVIALNASTGTTIGGAFSGAGNTISGNGRSGVRVTGAGTVATLEGNRVGTLPDGSAARANTLYGVRFDSGASGTVGGSLPGTGNLISGNGASGILLSAVSGVNVYANLIGTDAAGTSALGNGDDGVLVEAGATANTIGGALSTLRNVVSGNLDSGIHLKDLATSMNVVIGNYVGTDLTGSNPIPNETGVEIDRAAGNFVGGTTVGARNIISGNASAGILVQGNGVAGGGVNNAIANNYVGLNAAGTIAIPNQDGVVADTLAENFTLGGLSAAAANVISGNSRFGVLLSDAHDVTVQGNLIGVLPDGISAAGNGSHGVFVVNAASGNQIGGTEPGAGNTVANNGGAGVLVGSDSAFAAPLTTSAGTGNSILRNLISANTGLAIDLGPFDGSTANDTNDPDTGPNALQNFAVLNQATSDGHSTVVFGSLNSLGDAEYRLEFFSGASAGAAAEFLGSTNEVIAVGQNSVSFAIALNAGLFAGDFVTATATNLATGDTSELSLSIVVA